MNLGYLQQLVARQEVCGWLEDGCHGLCQLLVNRLDISGGIRLGLKHKLSVKRKNSIRRCQFNSSGNI